MASQHLLQTIQIEVGGDSRADCAMTKNIFIFLDRILGFSSFILQAYERVGRLFEKFNSKGFFEIDH